MQAPTRRRRSRSKILAVVLMGGLMLPNQGCAVLAALPMLIKVLSTVSALASGVSMVASLAGNDDVARTAGMVGGIAGAGASVGAGVGGLANYFSTTTGAGAAANAANGAAAITNGQMSPANQTATPDPTLASGDDLQPGGTAEQLAAARTDVAPNAPLLQGGEEPTGEQTPVENAPRAVPINSESPAPAEAEPESVADPEQPDESDFVGPPAPTVAQRQEQNRNARQKIESIGTELDRIGRTIGRAKGEAKKRLTARRDALRAERTRLQALIQSNTFGED